MVLQRNVSVYSDFKTGFLSKVCLVVGIFLLAVFICLKFLALIWVQDQNSFFHLIYRFAISDQSSSIIAFSIIFFGIGVISYFFHRQFAKLAKIAQEVENGTDDSNLQNK